MNVKLIRLLGAVCLVLFLVIISEWLIAKNAEKKLVAAISEIPEEDYEADELPTLDLTEHSEDEYADLVNRPLFIKGRRPVEEVPPEPEQATNTVTPETNFDWQLNGVFSGKKGLGVLVSRVKTRVPKDNFRRLYKGADLDGWKIHKIEKDKIILKQTDTEKELLLRKAKPKDASRLPSPAPPAVGIPPVPTSPGHNIPPVPGRGAMPPVPPPTPPGVQPDSQITEPAQDPFENNQ